MSSYQTLRNLSVATLGCLTLFSLFLPTNSFAQTGAAGVVVDAEGVVRMHRFEDPTGRLTRQRLAQMKSTLSPELSRPSKLRKVSLTRLESVVGDAFESGAGLTEEIQYLAGLTKIKYVFVYPESGDVVIAGPAEGFGTDLSGRVIGLSTGQSILELQDLIVALRAFAPGSNGTRQIGCSIDPTESGLERMQNYLVNATGQIDPADANLFAKGLRDSLGEQIVSVEGVSPKTHFAQILVEADYRMKLIGIGLEEPPVKISSYVSKANPNRVGRNSLQRWFFVPDYESVVVSDDALAMELVGEGVKLIGENEMVSRNGIRSAANTVDRASQLFVKSFTQRYKELAKKVPVYGQLRNIIDMSVVAAFMHNEDVFGQTGWDMSIFADEEKVPCEVYTVPETVGSAVNVVWKGNTLMTPIGGGVQIRPELALATANIQQDDAGKVAAAHESVELKEVPADQWWWD